MDELNEAIALENQRRSEVERELRLVKGQLDDKRRDYEDQTHEVREMSLDIARLKAQERQWEAKQAEWRRQEAAALLELQVEANRYKELQSHCEALRQENTSLED